MSKKRFTWDGIEFWFDGKPITGLEEIGAVVYDNPMRFRLSPDHIIRGCEQCVKDAAFVEAELQWLQDNAP